MTDAREKRIQDVLRYRQNDLTVVLENVSDPHNIAAVLRSCDAVGIMEVYVLNTKEQIQRKWDAQTSSSAAKWMKTHQFFDIKTCFEEVRKKYKQIFSTHLSASPKSIYELDLTPPTALVFGNERSGLSDEVLSYCDGNFIIPQVGMISSLNISVACAVSIYEGYRQKNKAGHYDYFKLPQTDETMLREYWLNGTRD
jgi:tRNA (guanosine-2'-O-)-methyltransferase